MHAANRTTRRQFMSGAATAVLASLSGDGLFAEEPIEAPSILRRLEQAALDAPLGMRFQGESAAECRAWQNQFGGKLRELLGSYQPPRSWTTHVQGQVELEDHIRQDLLLVAEGHPALPVYLLLPRPKSSRRRAGIVALHGHGSHGHHPIAGRDDLAGVADSIRSANYDYGRQLVRRGYVVACPCFTPFGVRLGKPEAFGKQDPCGDTFIRLQMLGKLLIAENLRDALWALELLAQSDEVDASRLGCVGLSYGGRMTMLTAAVEPRIKVAIISGALNVMQERISKPYSCGAQIIPGLLNFGDTPEIASLIAPRYALWEAGLRDGLVKPPWSDEALARIGRAYRALGAGDRLQVDRHDGGHVWHGEVAYPLLEKALA